MTASALRRLCRDRTAVAFGTLFVLLALAFVAAPLYASEVAETTFAENRLSEQITLDGERTPGSIVIPIAVIDVVYVPYLARPLRGEVLALRERRFVEAARACGMRSVRIMLSELLPHLWTGILVLAPLLFANAVVLESALSFLGDGVRRALDPHQRLGLIEVHGR